MTFDIAPAAITPIYRQIIDQVHRLVASGQLSPGSELPSVRSVALHHAINPMTVSKAYSLLEAQGLLERRRGVGMVVALRAKAAAPGVEPVTLLRPALADAAQVARQLGVSNKAALAAFAQTLRDTPVKAPHETK